MLCLVAAFCSVEALGQVSVDGAVVGQTIQGYANRAAYTGRRSPSVGYAGPVARAPASVAAAAAAIMASAELHAPLSGTLVAQPAVYEQAYRAPGDANESSPRNQSTIQASPAISAPVRTVAFSIEPWHQVRYRARHPRKYYDDVYYRRTHPRGTGGYGYYGGYYGYGYGFGFYSPYRYGFRSYGTYRANNYFDGYRYRRQFVRVNTPSRQRSFSLRGRGHGRH